MYPFHVQRIQALQPDGYAPHIAFSHDTLESVLQIPFSLLKCCFPMKQPWEGIFNPHNTRMWAEENPHLMQRHFSRDSIFG